MNLCVQRATVTERQRDSRRICPVFAEGGGPVEKVELDLPRQTEQRALIVRDHAELSSAWPCALLGLYYFRGLLIQVFVNSSVCVIITKELPPIERARSRRET